MPRQLEAGILYVSIEFGVAAHMCPCGCGNKIVTPLGPTDWTFTEKKGKPTLHPSISNWQLPCRSHYWIANGEIQWSWQWSDEQIQAGRRHEEHRRTSYFNNLNRKQRRKNFVTRVINWILRKK